MTKDNLTTMPPDSDSRGLSAASLLLHSVRSRDELIVSATHTLSDMIDAEGSSVVLQDPENGELVFYVVSGAKSNALKSFRLAKGEGITGHCIETASPVLANDVRTNPHFSPRADDTTGFTTRNILCVPLILEGACIGACTVVNSRRPEGFTDRDRVFGEIVASHIAVAIRNVQLSHAAVDSARLAALGQAVAGAAHCMKNLVLVLRGGVHIVRTEIDRAMLTKDSRGVAMIEENVSRLARLVDDMLTYAKDGQPAYTRADLEEIVCSAVRAMEPVAKLRSVSFEVDVEGELGAVELDNGGIYRCVLNLLANAIDACEAPGDCVRVAVGRAGEREVFIEVTDHGCGMDPRTRQALFQPFYSTKGTGGTGLGLSVTRKIIEEHGGRVEVDSEMGHGSTFRVFLPRARPLANHTPS